MTPLLDHCRALLPSIDQKRTCPPREMGDWVLAHIGAPMESVSDATVPSAPALTSLIWCLEDAKHERIFRERIYPRLVTGKIGEEGEARSDDGRKLDRLCERALEFHKRAIGLARAENLSSESALSEDVELIGRFGPIFG